MSENVDALVGNLMTLRSTWGLRVIGAITLLFVGRMVAGKIRRGTRRLIVRPWCTPADDRNVYFDLTRQMKDGL
jgi:hypothetical protein